MFKSSDQIGDNVIDILTDFKRSTMNVAQNIKPQVERKSFFTRPQIYGNMSTISAYRSVTMSLCITYWMICALFFIPSDYVIEDFEELNDTFRNNDEVVYDLHRFLLYFEGTYISRSRRNFPRLEKLFATLQLTYRIWSSSRGRTIE